MGPQALPSCIRALTLVACIVAAGCGSESGRHAALDSAARLDTIAVLRPAVGDILELYVARHRFRIGQTTFDSVLATLGRAPLIDLFEDDDHLDALCYRLVGQPMTILFLSNEMGPGREVLGFRLSRDTATTSWRSRCQPLAVGAQAVYFGPGLTLDSDLQRLEESLPAKGKTRSVVSEAWRRETRGDTTTYFWLRDTTIAPHGTRKTYDLSGFFRICCRSGGNATIQVWQMLSN